MKSIHQGKGGRFGKQGIDNIFITDCRKQPTYRKAKAGFQLVRMRRETDQRNEEGNIHSYKNFHKEPQRISLDVHLNKESRKILKVFARAAISEAGLVIVRHHVY